MLGAWPENKHGLIYNEIYSSIHGICIKVYFWGEEGEYASSRIARTLTDM